MQPLYQQREVSRNGVRLLKLAVLYLLIGLILGLAMAISGQFQLRPVHTHINLLGWSTLGLCGAIYCLFPAIGQTRLAHWHLWFHNLGLPIMMGALALYHLGHPQFEPLIGIGAVVTVTGLVLFAINLFRNIEGQASHKTLAGEVIGGAEMS